MYTYSVDYGFVCLRNSYFKVKWKKNGIKVQLHLKTQASVRNEMSGISYILRKFTSPSSTWKMNSLHCEICRYETIVSFFAVSKYSTSFQKKCKIRCSLLYCQSVNWLDLCVQDLLAEWFSLYDKCLLSLYSNTVCSFVVSLDKSHFVSCKSIIIQLQ